MKYINLVFLYVIVAILASGCGQQEDFYSFCKTTEGNLYKVQDVAPRCPWTQNAQVPLDQRVGF